MHSPSMEFQGQFQQQRDLLFAIQQTLSPSRKVTCLDIYKVQKQDSWYWDEPFQIWGKRGSWWEHWQEVPAQHFGWVPALGQGNLGPRTPCLQDGDNLWFIGWWWGYALCMMLTWSRTWEAFSMLTITDSPVGSENLRYATWFGGICPNSDEIGRVQDSMALDESVPTLDQVDFFWFILTHMNEVMWVRWHQVVGISFTFKVMQLINLGTCLQWRTWLGKYAGGGNF